MAGALKVSHTQKCPFRLLMIRKRMPTKFSGNGGRVVGMGQMRQLRGGLRGARGLPHALPERSVPRRIAASAFLQIRIVAEQRGPEQCPKRGNYIGQVPEHLRPALDEFQTLDSHNLIDAGAIFYL